MPISRIYESLRAIAGIEFGDIIVSIQTVSLPTGVPLKLRFDIVDGSLLDIFISVSGRYSYHWERRLSQQMIFTAMTMHRIKNGAAWRPSQSTSIMAAKAMWSRVISATPLKMPCASF